MKGDSAQIVSVLSTGDNKCIIDLNGFGQSGVGMSGNDKVNTVYRLRQFIIFTFPVFSPRMGKTDDIIR